MPSKEEHALYHPARLIVYPWKVWEWLLPNRWNEWFLSQVWEEVLRARENRGNFKEKIYFKLTARTAAWRAQFALLQVEKAFEKERKIPEGMLPEGVRDLLLEAEKAAKLAILLRPKKSTFVLRAYIRTLLGKCQEAQRDFFETENSKAIVARRNYQKGLKALQNAEWTRARILLGKAKKHLPHDREPPYIFKVAKYLENIDDILNFCFRKKIVTIGQNRIRYLEKALGYLDQAKALIAEAVELKIMEEKRSSELILALNQSARFLGTGLAKEIQSQPPGGDFHSRLLNVRAQLSAFLK